MQGLVAEVGSGLNTAWLLALGRADGVRLLNPAAPEAGRTAARSFWAIAISLPAFVCLHLLDWAEGGAPPHLARSFALDLIGYAVYWLGFAVISHALAGTIGRSRHWPRYIAVWNWCNVIQYMMLTAAALPTLLGLPDWVGQTAGLVAMGWALWLEWFATRITLELGPVSAGVMTALDVMLGLMIVGVTGAL